MSRMEQAPMTMDVAVEWDTNEAAYFAVFLRDRAPWLLDGALVGTGGTPGAAVDNLLGLAHHLVEHGENFLYSGPLPVADRRWLFERLEPHTTDAEFAAVRTAEAAFHP